MSTLGKGSAESGAPVPGYRKRVPIPFGGGVDRHSGVMVVEAPSFEYLWNVHLFRGKAQLRRGLDPILTAFADGGATIDSVLAIQALQSRNVAVIVGYDSAAQAVHVYTVNGDGTGTPVHIGLWFTLAAGAADPPTIIACEGYERVFLAHDERYLSFRASTVYYDIVSTSLKTLSADWAVGDTLAPVDADEEIKFRGVTTYLDYLVGWGFGTKTDGRAEIVRISLPEDQATFDAEHYWTVGQKGVPVLACAAAGDVLLAMKASSTHRLIGTSWLDFGMLMADARYGIAGSRLAVPHRGELYVWTQEGPRVSSGGPFQNLSLPLDLPGHEPTDVRAHKGAASAGFGFYLPTRNEILWSFGRIAYVLHLDEPLRWSYRDWGADEYYCAGTLYGGVGDAGTNPDPSEVPTGYPEYVSASVGDDSASIQWTNHAPESDLTVDVFYRLHAGGAWTKEGVAIQMLTTQLYALATTLDPVTQYDVALRYRRGDLTTPGYEDEDPDNWTDDAGVEGTPADSKGTFTTTLAAPTIDSTTWDRDSSTAESVAVVITPHSAVADVRVERDGVLVELKLAAAHAGAQFTVSDVSDGDPTDFAGETVLHYVATTVFGGVDGGVDTAAQWAGPSPAPYDLVVVPASSGYLLTWEVDGLARGWSVERDINDGNGFLWLGSPKTTSYEDPGGLAGYRYRVRKAESAFTVTDYSDYSNIDTA